MRQGRIRPSRHFPVRFEMSFCRRQFARRIDTTSVCYQLVAQITSPISWIFPSPVAFLCFLRNIFFQDYSFLPTSPL